MNDNKTKILELSAKGVRIDQIHSIFPAFSITQIRDICNEEYTNKNQNDYNRTIGNQVIATDNSNRKRKTRIQSTSHKKPRLSHSANKIRQDLRKVKALIS